MGGVTGEKSASCSGSMKELSPKDLAVLEMAGPSSDPQYGGMDYDVFGQQARTTDAFGVPVSSLTGKLLGEKDMGAVQGGGARRRRRQRGSRKTHRVRRVRRKTAGRNRSGKSSKFALNFRARIRI